MPAKLYEANDVRSRRVMTMTLVLWWAVHLYLGIVAVTSANGAQSILETTESGSWTTPLQVLTFGALGALNLGRAKKVLFEKKNRHLLIGLAAYCLWAIASVLWSGDSSLSIRRVSELLLVLLGCCGLGIGYYGGRPGGMSLYLRHVLWGGFTAACALLCQEIVAPVSRGAAYDLIWTALYAMVALAYWPAKTLWRVVPLAVPLVAVFVVFQPRAATLFVVVTCIGVSVFFRRKTIVIGLVLLGLVAGTFTLTNTDSHGRMGSLLSDLPFMSQNDNATTLDSLNGRTLIWDHLMPFVWEHPAAGYGFGAFWNGSHLIEVWRAVGWPAPVGHNGYLDETLGTGVVGLSLLLFVWLSGIVCAYRTMRCTGAPAATAIAACLILTLLLNTTDTIFQFPFRFPFYGPLVGLFGLLGRWSAATTRPEPWLVLRAFRREAGTPSSQKIVNVIS